jgi:hypothetical protein
MGHRSDPTFRVLHALKLRGFADAAVVAEVTGLSGAEIDRYLAEAAEAGWARRREGRICGWALTPEGRSRDAESLWAEREASGCREVVSAVYDEFAELNGRFKELCTDWQLRTLGANQVPNDHTDAIYDRSVIAGLVAIDEGAQPMCLRLGQALDRMAGYGPRLSRALARVQSGDRDGFARPLANSYHDVWMEMHEDLIATLGLVRTAADA